MPRLSIAKEGVGGICQARAAGSRCIGLDDKYLCLEFQMWQCVRDPPSCFKVACSAQALQQISQSSE
jgi:hypothetical protein